MKGMTEIINNLYKKFTIAYENDSEYKIDMVQTIQNNIDIAIEELNESNKNQEIFGKISRGGNGKVTIHINTNLTSNEKRFTLAHELGHALMHYAQSDLYLNYKAYIDYKEFNTKVTKSFSLYDKEENEANDFAQQFLMPIDKLYKYFGEYLATTDIKNNYPMEIIENFAITFGIDRYLMKSYLDYMNLSGIYLNSTVL